MVGDRPRIMEQVAEKAKSTESVLLQTENGTRRVARQARQRIAYRRGSTLYIIKMVEATGEEFLGRAKSVGKRGNGHKNPRVGWWV